MKLKKIIFEEKTAKLKKHDWLIIAVMVILYGILSFYKLGDIKIPNTYKTFDLIGNSETIVLKEETYIRNMRYYTGNGLGEIKVFTSLDGEDYQEVTTLYINSVFSWQETMLGQNAKYIRFVANQPSSTLGEVQFYKIDETKIPIIIKNNNPLTDELDLVPDEISYLNSTYFDEIYYARTAYEYVHGINCYEWTHPPLGKLIMCIPILLFGFSPFTYRLMGNIAGILLIPVMYILAKKIFKSRKYATLAALLMMFDNFHFAHTRIALIDGFQVLFILLSILFMKNYMDLEKNSPFKKKALYLLLSGTFIGCALATKWNAAYILVGLAIVFFIHLLKEYNINVIKFLKEKISIKLILKYSWILLLIPFVSYFLIILISSRKSAIIIILAYYILTFSWLAIRLFKFLFKDKYLIKLLIVCTISFIVIPFVIYILSYVLFPKINYYENSFMGIIEMTKMMYSYHSGLTETHPFQSYWYEWPVMIRPVWFYSGNNINGLRSTITDIGNPAIWWFGVLAFIYLVISAIKKKNSVNIFLLIFILSSYMPSVLIARPMFMYHYFITLPFIMLGIVSLVKTITERTKDNKFYYSYIFVVIAMFFIFYPVVSGMTIKDEYIVMLRWLSSWIF